MKLVIDINNSTYEAIKHKYCAVPPQKRLLKVLWGAIKNGTPFPKGHGRIIDYGYVVDAIDDWINAEEYDYTNATDYLRNRIRNIPTIIEADKESNPE